MSFHSILLYLNYLALAWAVYILYRARQREKKAALLLNILHEAAAYVIMTAASRRLAPLCQLFGPAQILVRFPEAGQSPSGQSPDDNS